MRTSELHKGQPIITFLAPTSANATSFRQPTQSSLNDPTTRRIFFVIWNWFRQWFAASPSMSNMLLVISLCHKKVHVIEIITFIQTEMLFFRWPVYHNRNDKVINRPFIMLICTGNMNRQRRTPLINQDVNLCPAFAPIGGIISCFLSTQRRWHRFAVDCLPFPTDPSLPIVETNHRLQDFLPNALLLPSLEPFMQDAAGNTKPIFVNCFPLTACPQDVPEAIDDGSIVGTRSSWTSPFGWLGQMLLDATPQGAWDSEIIDILWLCATLVFINDAPPWMKFFRKDNSPRGASFFQVNLFFG